MRDGGQQGCGRCDCAGSVVRATPSASVVAVPDAVPAVNATRRPRVAMPPAERTVADTGMRLADTGAGRADGDRVGPGEAAGGGQQRGRLRRARALLAEAAGLVAAPPGQGGHVGAGLGHLRRRRRTVVLDQVGERRDVGALSPAWPAATEPRPFRTGAGP